MTPESGRGTPSSNQGRVPDTSGPTGLGFDHAWRSALSLWHHPVSALSIFVANGYSMAVSLWHKTNAIYIRIVFFLELIHTAPWPIRKVMQFSIWAVFATAMVFVASRLVISGLVVILSPLTTALAPLAGYIQGPDGYSLPRLAPLEHLGKPTTIRWTIDDTLVDATSRLDSVIQSLLGQCDLSEKIAYLRLAPGISIQCQRLNSQIDSPPGLVTLRNNSTETQSSITWDMAREFDDHAAFLRLLRRDPATAAFNPLKVEDGSASLRQQLFHPLDVAYRTAWRRWLRQEPMSTLETRRSKVYTMFDASYSLRKKWQSEFIKSLDALTKKRKTSCQRECGAINEKADELGPGSFSPSYAALIMYPGRRQGARTSRHDTEATRQLEVVPPPGKGSTKTPKDLAVQHTMQHGLQKAAEWCAARCLWLDQHIKDLDDILYWLNAEIEWWDQARKSIPNATQADPSTHEGVHRFEDNLDTLVKAAMARGRD